MGGQVDKSPISLVFPRKAQQSFLIFETLLQAVSLPGQMRSHLGRRPQITVQWRWSEKNEKKREMSYFLMVISSAHFITSHVVLHRTSRHLDSNTWLFFPISQSSWKELIIISSHTQIHRIFFNLHANKMFIIKSPFSCCGFNSRIFFTTQSDGDLGLKW